MAKSGHGIIIGGLLLLSVLLFFLANKILFVFGSIEQFYPEYSWLVHGIVNVLCYSTVLCPGFLIYKYIRKSNYISAKESNPRLKSLLNFCFGEPDLSPVASSITQQSKERSFAQECTLLTFYFLGLQVSYLSWGVLQEKVMTQTYYSADGEMEYFKDSQFLVFVNRVLAFGITSVYLVCQQQFRQHCPLYKYSFCSLSNIMSSWCQYEALKYVSFPHQVLAKAAKPIPVMIMGKIVSRTKYEYYEYITAVILSMGMLIFMLDTGNDKAVTKVTTLSGAILLLSYIAFDSFTSNWQGKLFKAYSMRPVQMMCAINFFSCIFTLLSLLLQGNMGTSLAFMLKYPNFTIDCILLSIFSAAGQLFIYSTVANFGPLVFAIITTIRQGFSVLLSCLIYGHEIHTFGIFGIALVFFGVLLRSYCSYRIKLLSKKLTAKTPPV